VLINVRFRRKRTSQFQSVRIEKFGSRFLSPRVAERVGFEPTIRFPVYTLSKRAP